MNRGDVERAMEYLQNLDGSTMVKLINNENEILESGSVKEIKEFLAEDASDTPFLCCLDRDEELNRIFDMIRGKGEKMFTVLYKGGSEVRSASLWMDWFFSEYDEDDEIFCDVHEDTYRGFVEGER